MSDESFRLTPVEVRRWQFKRALRGYDPIDVDGFRDQVADEMERLVRQNSELDAKSKGLVEQLRAFRERDKALNDALVSAQQLRQELREQADREAQLILREARAEGERMVDAARAEVRRIEAEMAALEKARRAFVSQVRILVERQLQELEAFEAVTPPHSGEGAETEEQPPRAAMQTPAWLNSLVKE
jgi:DivIVA domain-containing protein